MQATEALSVRLADDELWLDAANSACSGCSGCGWLPRQAARLPVRLLSDNIDQSSQQEPVALHASLDRSALANVVTGIFATLLSVLFVLVAVGDWFALGGVLTALLACLGVALVVAVFGARRRQIEKAISLRLSPVS